MLTSSDAGLQSRNLALQAFNFLSSSCGTAERGHLGANFDQQQGRADLVDSRYRLQQDQQRLAIQALNGKKRVFGTVAQGVTLKAALRALKERDR